MASEDEPNSSTSLADVDSTSKLDEKPIYYNWEEISLHDRSNPAGAWIVLHDIVYDVTTWISKHPGGSRVIGHYCGQDASEAFQAFHPDPELSMKFLVGRKVGELSPHERNTPEIITDFRQLRDTVERLGYMQPKKSFFFLWLLHILVLEWGAFGLLVWFGFTKWNIVVTLIMMTTAQVQAGWLQHDFGHLSVFKSVKMNHALHYFTMPFIKGATAVWWNHNHYQHHSKPNVLTKDPDTRLDFLFVVGKLMPGRVANDPKHHQLPYNHQHKYFFFTLPPLLFPTFFWYQQLKSLSRAKPGDKLACLFFYLTFFPIVIYAAGGFWKAFLYHLVLRILESNWFVWVAQSNHVPMEIQDDLELDWVRLQLQATCNVEGGWFNDWFTGHLNYQIEHHLFPRMPRHNLHKVRPLVESLCKKHGVSYECKPLMTAFADIYRALKQSGQMWLEAYDAVLYAQM